MQKFVGGTDQNGRLILKCPSIVTFHPDFQCNFLAAVTFRGHLGFTMTLSTKVRRRRNGTDPTLILNLALLIVPPVVLVLVFRQWLARHIRWTVALTALCDVLLFWDELFYYESFGLFAVLILVQLAAAGAAAFRIYNKQRKD